MADIPVRTGSEVFQFSGYFEWPGLYLYITSWMKANLLKIYEPVFKDKTNTNGVTEREISLYGEVKMDRMSKKKMKIDLHLWDCEKVEVTKDSKTKKLERGRIQIKINSSVDNDHQKLFSTPTGRKLSPIYNKIIGIKYGATTLDDWFEKSHELFIGIKNYLGVDTE